MEKILDHVHFYHVHFYEFRKIDLSFWIIKFILGSPGFIIWPILKSGGPSAAQGVAKMKRGLNSTSESTPKYVFKKSWFLQSNQIDLQTPNYNDLVAFSGNLANASDFLCPTGYPVAFQQWMAPSDIWPLRAAATVGDIVRRATAGYRVVSLGLPCSQFGEGDVEAQHVLEMCGGLCIAKVRKENMSKMSWSFTCLSQNEHVLCTVHACMKMSTFMSLTFALSNIFSTTYFFHPLSPSTRKTPIRATRWFVCDFDRNFVRSLACL